MVDRSRRHILGATAGAATVALVSPLAAMAQTREVKVAVLVPLSGAWARSGEFHVKGAELAVKHINDAGGIKALGGAKMKLVTKEATGKAPKTVAIIMDNTASPASFTKPMREGGFEKLGMKLVVDEIYTPPLSDATSMVQKVRNARPDLLLVLTTNVPDSKMILEKMNEMGIGKGRIPVLASGSSLGMPEL